MTPPHPPKPAKHFEYLICGAEVLAKLFSERRSHLSANYGAVKQRYIRPKTRAKSTIT
jgi:hypothetical protein